MMFLSVVIPTYNEEKRIIQTLEIIRNFLVNQNYQSEVIVVDDGSNDKTITKVKKFQLKAGPPLTERSISYQTNRGKGYAVRKGMLAARGQCILFTDADNSTPIEEVNKLLVYKDDFAVVTGSRYLLKNSIKLQQKPSRRILSRLGAWLIKTIIRLPLTDTQCGFKLFSQQAAKTIFNLSTIDRWGFDIEILAIAQELSYKIREVPINWYNDPGSQLRANRAAWQTFKELLVIKSNLRKEKYQRRYEKPNYHSNL